MKLVMLHKSGRTFIAMLSLFALFGLAGCANADILDSGDMKDVELVTALAVDSSVDDTPEESLQVTVQLLNRDKALDRQYAESYYNLAAAGANLPAAIGELYRYGARQLNFSHTSVLLLSDTAADAEFWLDYALRSPELRPTVYPVVCRGQAGEILTGEAEGISLTYLLDNILEPLGSGRSGAAAISLQNFVEDLMQPGITPALPLVEQSESLLTLCGVVLYDDEGRQRTMAADEDFAAYQGWLWLCRPEYLRGYTLELSNGVVLQIESAAVQRSLQVSAAKPNLQFHIELRAQVLRNPQTLPEAYLQQLVKQRLQDLTVAALAFSREHNLDFLGIGREVYRQQPALWAEIADDANYLQLLTVSLETGAEIMQQ